MLPCALLLMMQSCLGDDNTNDYTDWINANRAYVDSISKVTENGLPVYKKITPDWAPNNSVYIKWHNDTTLTSKNLSPMSNSTVNITYRFENIYGTLIQDSYSNTAHGDSIYQSRPNQNIVGMWVGMLNMHVGDSVTMVIPSESGYGAQSSSAVAPYSTLVYHVKMKGIPSYEKK